MLQKILLRQNARYDKHCENKCIERRTIKTFKKSKITGLTLTWK